MLGFGILLAIAAAAISLWFWIVLQGFGPLGRNLEFDCEEESLSRFQEPDLQILRRLVDGDLNESSNRKAVSHFLRGFEIDCKWNPSGTISRIGKLGAGLTDDNIPRLCWMLSELPQIEELSLCNSEISDKSVKHIIEIENVGCLRLIRTQISPKCLDEIEKSLPNVRVER